MPEETVEELVSIFVSMRDELSAKRKEFKEFEANQKLAMEQIECKLLDLSRSLGVKSFATDYGTAFKTNKIFVRVGNWDKIIKFIVETENYQMLEKRIGKIATLEILEDLAKSNVAPEDIGVEYVSEEVIQVRRS